MPDQRPLSEQQFNSVVDRVMQSAPAGLDEAGFNAFLDSEVAKEEAAYRPKPVATGGGRGTGLDVRKSDAWAKANAPVIGGSIAALSGGSSLPLSALLAAGGGAGGSLLRGDTPEQALTEGAIQGVIEGGGGLASKVLSKGARKLYTSLLKPKDATLQRFPGVVEDLMASHRPISQPSQVKALGAMKDIGRKKGVVLATADATGQMIPREELRSGLDDVLTQAIKSSDTPVKDLDKLAKIERELLPDEAALSPSRADALKSKVQSESDRGFRQMRQGTRINDTGARAKLAVAHKAQKAVERVAPDVAPLNKAYASEKGQATALRDALKREGNTNVIGMRDLIGAGVGAGAGMGGDNPGAGALTGVGLMRLLAQPRAGSMAAIAGRDIARLPMAQLIRAIQMGILSEEPK